MRGDRDVAGRISRNGKRTGTRAREEIRVDTPSQRLLDWPRMPAGQSEDLVWRIGHVDEDVVTGHAPPVSGVFLSRGAQREGLPMRACGAERDAVFQPGRSWVA